MPGLDAIWRAMSGYLICAGWCRNFRNAIASRNLGIAFIPAYTCPQNTKNAHLPLFFGAILLTYSLCIPIFEDIKQNKLTLWRSLLPHSLCQTGLIVIFDIRPTGHSDAQPWALECPDVKNYKWRLNPAWHRMLYSCTHMATVGVKVLTRAPFDSIH